jgi:hypothetical protein
MLCFICVDRVQDMTALQAAVKNVIHETQYQQKQIYEIMKLLSIFMAFNLEKMLQLHA